MRLLHAWYDHGRPWPAAALPRPKPGCDRRGDAEQHLPLRGLWAYRAGHPPGSRDGRRGAGRRAMSDAQHKTTGPGARRSMPDPSEASTIGEWLHIEADGTIIVYTGKAEVGQNIRTSLAQAVAEELRTPIDGIQL